MASTKTTSKDKSTGSPNFFRLNIEVGDLDAAAEFYGTLLGQTGRKQAGSRVYFQCGAVTLQVVQVPGQAAHRGQGAVLHGRDLDAIFERARRCAASRRRTCTANPAARSPCDRGASARSTPTIRGATRCASSRPERPTRAEEGREFV
jgi:catechol 2,3-dioxygenase-like lactoylglutathione lyase family enzyme